MSKMKDFIDHDLEFDATRNIYFLKPRSNRSGISNRYTEYAQDDAKKYLDLIHLYSKLNEIIQKNNFSMNNINILDIGSGFGNTVLPVLRDYPSVHVVATDLSDSMLEVLRNFAIEMSIEDRLNLLEIDAKQLNIIKPNSFELIIGGAALHHFVEPEKVLLDCFRILKKNGMCIFFEPMELGLTLFALCLESALPSISKSGEYGESASRFFEAIIKDITVRVHHATDKNSPDWRDLDDKWVFARSYLENIARMSDVQLEVLPLNNVTSPFLTQAKTILKLYGGIDPNHVFNENIENIFLDFEYRFSKYAFQDSPLEAALIFKKA